MGLPSKEDNVLGLFFNEPSRQWHFKDIIKTANISRQQANKWLKRLVKQNIIIHVKNNGKMPFFIANFNHSDYKNNKKLFALKILSDSGFLAHLQGLSRAKAIIIFGSFVRSDWHKDSDIDLFIFGNPAGLETARFWKKLGREIQAHVFSSKSNLKNIKSGLLGDVIDGYLVKGSMNEFVNVP
ncbi:nucleotidyltransferase domain-containing protein [Candidatus Woesearchaeota archaeon]|nr:nucleotidyltransferase domain-containing protein [Candidatus Woesearchaeota archaeon]